MSGGHWDENDIWVKEPTYVLGNFPSSRDVILVTFFNEDGSLFRIKDWMDEDIDWCHEGELSEREFEFYERYMYLFSNNFVDTVAYIPNAVMDSMQPLMEAAFEKGNKDNDWSVLLHLFKNGYKFIPISGEEYKELARQGKN